MRVIFDKVGVFEKKPNDPSSDASFKVIVSKALRDPSDPMEGELIIECGDDDDDVKVYPVDLNEVDTDKDGNLHFEIFDAKYTIRGLVPEDGKWHRSLKYKIDLPVKVLEYMLNPNLSGEKMAETQEMLVSYSKNDTSGPVFGVEYSNSALGSFIRSNGAWLMLSPQDETFEGMYVTVIDPEKSEDFLNAYDKGGMTVEQADAYADPDVNFQI